MQSNKTDSAAFAKELNYYASQAGPTRQAMREATRIRDLVCSFGTYNIRHPETSIDLDQCLRDIKAFPEQIDRMIRDKEDTIKHIEELAVEGQRIIEGSSWYKMNSQQQADEVEKFIKDTKAELYLDPYPVVDIPINPITLEHNSFKITTDVIYLRIIPRRFPKLYAQGTCLEKTDLIHPHIGEDGEICLGEARAAIFAAISRCDLYSIVDIVESMLSEYNPRSPYLSIEKILGLEVCHLCGEIDDDEEIRDCDDCDDPTCSNCIQYVNTPDGDRYLCDSCMDHYVQLECCDRGWVYEGDYYTCGKCGMTMCYACKLNDPTENYSYLCEACYDEVLEEEENKEEQEEDQLDIPF